MRNLFRKLISVLLIVACVFINTSAFAESNLTIHFLDVGQGAAAIIQCDGEVMMFDGGSAGNSSFIYSYLQKKNAHLLCVEYFWRNAEFFWDSLYSVGILRCFLYSLGVTPYCFLNTYPK